MKVGDKVVGNKNHFPHRRGKTGTIADIHLRGYLVDWGDGLHFSRRDEIDKVEDMDLAKIEKAFGLLDKETQEALKNHKGKIEVYSCSGWMSVSAPGWFRGDTYRAAPELKIKEMTVEQISKALGYEVKIVK